MDQCDKTHIRCKHHLVTDSLGSFKTLKGHLYTRLSVKALTLLPLLTVMFCASLPVPDLKCPLQPSPYYLFLPSKGLGIVSFPHLSPSHMQLPKAYLTHAVLHLATQIKIGLGTF